MRVGENEISVCDWSLHCESVPSLLAAVRQLGLDRVHLALGGLVSENGTPRAEKVAELLQSGIKFSAGMVGFQGEDYASIAVIRRTGGFVPDELWPQRRRWLQACREVASKLGIAQVTTHIGFVPPSSEPGYGRMVERVQRAADDLAAAGMSLLMETGQEPADELLQFLNDVSRPTVGVNFDPANMILYGAGDPISAVRTLGRHIRHVHIKDAVASNAPGLEWGREVAFGQGQVGAAGFLAALRSLGYTGVLAIEREAGATRMDDVREAIRLIREQGVRKAD